MTLPVENLPETDLIVVRSLGLHDYEPLWRKMQQFTASRSTLTPDEIWFTEHPPVFTLGLNASREHLLTPGDIPVIQVDRGGQVTYHGPGQLMIYPLLDLKRAGLGVRDLVTGLEQTVVDLLADFDIEAASRKDAPGVYVEGRKIASVGLRVRRGGSYHGMALNIDMDLEPFSRINPCGFSDLEVTDLTALEIGESRMEIQERVQAHLLRHLRMNHRQVVSDSE
ncbi:lipoyl-protein ligase [uncultured Woeseiaceae bacterium]|uniref:Octanoyltransferase n=1 Tax=uncultured Woeseiaceae bacterium TaxID=1983305 RepID=A0A7D9D2Q8_9GAMM|nr:lipoyl-protein ligase [uncultured Woeseiaceae bacterium]